MATNNCIIRLAVPHPAPVPMPLHRTPFSTKGGQAGASLITVIVIVLVLLIGAIAVFQSVESTSLVAGNMAFREATRQAADVAIDKALNDIRTLSNPEASIDNKYFPLRQAETGEVPKTADWSKVETTTVRSYNVQYVIERMCTGTTPVTAISQCLTQVGYDTTGRSNKVGGLVPPAATDIIYRITIRTTGPKNAEAYTQVLVGKKTYMNTQSSS